MRVCDGQIGTTAYPAVTSLGKRIRFFCSIWQIIKVLFYSFIVVVYVTVECGIRQRHVYSAQSVGELSVQRRLRARIQQQQRWFLCSAGVLRQSLCEQHTPPLPPPKVLARRLYISTRFFLNSLYVAFILIMAAQ